MSKITIEMAKDMAKLRKILDKLNHGNINNFNYVLSLNNEKNISTIKKRLMLRKAQLKTLKEQAKQL